MYYGIHNNGIVFASQFDQIFHHKAFQNKKLRPEIMKEYFGLGYMQAPNTVFENIFQVQPSQIITWSFKQNAITSKTEFFSWNCTNKINETSLEAVKKFETIFESVIQSQLHACLLYTSRCV